MTAASTPSVPAAPAVARPGRPSLFTPERCALVLDCLRKGYKRKLACATAGIAYDTFQGWLEGARQDETSPYYPFSLAVHEAETAGRAVLVDSWLAQTTRDWKAAAKYLAIVDPDEYSEQRQLRVQHSGTVAHVHVAVAQLDLAHVAGLLGLSEGETIDAEVHTIEHG